MKFALLFVGLALVSVSASAQPAHQTSFVHNGQTVAVSYEPKFETRLRQTGLGPRAMPSCLWTSRTFVQRTVHAADGQPIAALTRVLSRERTRSGLRTGSCTGLTDETKAGLAGSDKAVRSHVLAVATDDAQGLRAGACEELFERHACIGVSLGCNRALIAIAKRIRQRFAIGAEPHVIDSPAIDSNGSDALRRALSRLAQAFIEPGENCFERPVQRCALMYRAVGNAMHQIDCRLAVDPLQQ